MVSQELRMERASEEGSAMLLAALIHLLKPARVAECGTYPGRTARALGEALFDTGGQLDTVELIPDCAERMVSELDGLPVTVLREPIQDFAAYPLTYLDSGPTYHERVQDLLVWQMTASPGAFAVCDDVNDGWIMPLIQQAGLIIPSVHGILLLRR